MFELEASSSVHHFVVDGYARGEGNMYFETKFSNVADPHYPAGVAVYFDQLGHAVGNFLIGYREFRDGLQKFSTGINANCSEIKRKYETNVNFISVWTIWTV